MLSRWILVDWKGGYGGRGWEERWRARGKRLRRRKERGDNG